MGGERARFVFDFAEGNKDQKDLLGGKGANLAEMTNLGLPVPPGFIVSTEACRAYFDEGGAPEGLAGEIRSHLAKVEAVLGPVDIIVNNAGITRDATMKKMNRNAWDEVLDTNLGGCFNMCKVAWDGMLNRSFGRIVNIGSINGQAGQYGQVNYAAAKSGIHGFTKALSQEGAAKGITVNAIAPGYIDTDMVAAVPADVLEKIVARIPVKRLGQAHEIARGVLFLVADDAGFITGSTISINGGQHMY